MSCHCNSILCGFWAWSHQPTGAWRPRNWPRTTSTPSSQPPSCPTCHSSLHNSHSYSKVPGTWNLKTRMNLILLALITSCFNSVNWMMFLCITWSMHFASYHQNPWMLDTLTEWVVFYQTNRINMIMMMMMITISIIIFL